MNAVKGLIRYTIGCALTFFCLLFLTTTTFAVSREREVKRGNTLYAKEEYDEALEKYNNALAESPDSDVINFDIGAAYYKKEDYGNAEDTFTRSLATEDKKLEAKANYNIGNTKYRQANLKENTDFQGAVRGYRQSLDYYKRAIELDETDEDAKFNYEFTEKKIKMLLENQQKDKKEKKEEKKEKDKKKDKEDQDEKKEDKKDEQDKKKDQEKEEEKKEEQEKQKQQKDKQKDEEKKEEEDKKEEKEGEGEKKEEDKKKEDQRKREEDKRREEEERKEEEEREKKKREQEKREQDRKEQKKRQEDEKSKEEVAGKEKEGEPGEGEKEPEERPAKMSEQQARMLLEGFRQEEESKSDLKQVQPTRYYPDVQKDW